MYNDTKLQNNCVVIFRDLSLKNGIFTITKDKKRFVLSDGKKYDINHIVITAVK